MPERDLVFFSYKHEDARWLELIDSALKPYVLYGKLSVWSDRDIEVGSRWENDIQHALERTRVAVLIISQRFFGSEFIREKELPLLISAAEQGLLVLICVPVGPVDLRLLSSSRLDSYQFPFPPDRPLSALPRSRREDAVVKVAVLVEQAYNRGSVKPFFNRTGVEPALVLVPAAPHREAVPLPDAAAEAVLRAYDAEELSLAPLVGVPALDERYVERPEALARLKALILQGANFAAGVTSTDRLGQIGLHGMGGMGKTVVAQAFCHDGQVRRAFSDGIFWLTLGQQPSLLAYQTVLLQMLGDPVSALESVSQARQLLRARLEGKRVLLVIDDLWDADHFLQAFDIATGQSRVLITTRDASLLTAIGAAEEVLGRMDDSQAQRLIAEWARVDVAELPASSVRVADLCGHLPLALALAGAQIADGLKWETLVEELKAGKIRFLDHPYGSVFHSLGRSVDALSEFEQARYLELAVFPEDAQIPPGTIARLWRHSGGLNDAETEKLLGRFHRKALLKNLDAGAGTFISFHDLQRDFLRIRAESAEVLSARLLDAYRSTLGLPQEATGWSALPRDEPYLWNRLAFHLVEAQRQDELHSLLVSIAWIGAKLDASTTVRAGRTSADVNALLSDYELLTDLPDVALVQHALRMSMHVIGAHPEQAAFQIYGRLGTSETPSIRRLCIEALNDYSKTPLAPVRSALSPPGFLALTLSGHEDWVYGATLLPDGRRVLSWSGDRTLRVWDLERGQVLHTLIGHETWVYGVTLLREGERALSWSYDRTLRVWDLQRGEALHTLTGHESSVSGATLLADGRRALSWSYDRTLRVWDLQRGEALHTLSGHESSVNGATLLADGRHALSWSDDGTLRLWDVERGEALHMLSGHESQVDGATLLSDGRRALSSSGDRTLRVWDLERGEALHTLSGHEDWVNGATLLADGRRVLSWSRDRTLRVWDLDRGVLVGSYFADAVLCPPAIDEVRHRIFTGDRLGRIHIIRLNIQHD